MAITLCTEFKGSESKLYSDVFIEQLTPVNSSIGTIEATDEDSEVLYYTMEQTMVWTWFIYLSKA